MRVTIAGSFTVTAVEDGAQGSPAPSYHIIRYGWSSAESAADQYHAPTDILMWTESIPQQTEGKPYLWMSDTLHTWNGEEYVVSIATYARLTGESGTGFHAKGSVPTVADLANISPVTEGDAYIVQADGHLYVYNGTGWSDFGEVKGDDGLPSYIHIAWAHAVGEEASDFIGFSTSKTPTENFEFMGIYTDNTQADSTDPLQYTWTRINGSVYVDLDNDNDTMLYSGGTLISGNVTSNATLYVGGSPIVTGVTWTCETENATATIASGTITVTGLTANQGWVLAKATYNGVTYTAKLSLKRSESDKYDILPSAKGIAYNITDNVPRTSVLTFQIRKTDISGNSTLLNSVPAGKTLTVMGKYSDNTYSLLTPTHVGYLWTITFNTETYVSIDIELKEGDIVDDMETVPIIRASNGNSGADAVALTLTPPAIVLPLDPWEQVKDFPQTFFITAHLDVGGEEAEITSIIADMGHIPDPDAWAASSSGDTLSLTTDTGEGCDLEGVIYVTVTGTCNGISYTREARLNVTSTEDGSPGAAGKNAVKLDLDNEMDSMQYYDGTQVTTSVVTRARLYDGNTPKSLAKSAWSYEVDGVTLSGNDFSVSGAVATFTVSGISKDKGTLTVKATYGGVTYSSVFSVTRIDDVNTPKYQLICTPTAITSNSTDNTLSSNTVKVEVMKTTLVLDMSTKRPKGVNSSVSSLTAEGLTLFVSTAESGDGTNKTSSWSSGKYVHNVSASDNFYRFTLKNADGVVDVETVPLAKVQNGESSLYADLSNEMDAVPMTYEGEVFESTALTTVVSMYYGSALQALTSVTCGTLPQGVTLTSTSAELLQGIVKLSVAAGISLANDKAVVDITASCAKGTKTVTFTVAGVRAGEEGTSPVIYQLNPSATAIKKSKEGTLSPTYITCGILKREGNSAPVVAEDGVANITYSVNGGSEQAYTGRIEIASSTTGIVFKLYQSSVLIDVESVPVVEDGQDGEGTNAVRLDIDNEADIMQYKTTAVGIVKVTDSVVAHVTLYDGETPVQADSITKTHLGTTSATLSGYSNERYTLTVSALGTDRDTIVVKATHNGTEYTATFSVVRLVDGVKYALDISPKSIGYNRTTEEYTVDPDLTVKARKYDVDGTESNVANLKTEGLYLSVRGWNGEVYASLYGGLYNGGTYTRDIWSYIVDGYSEFVIELRKGTASGILYDMETIPILFVSDGDSVTLEVQYSPDQVITHDEYANGDIWMRTKKSNASSWGAWVRIVGESGGETDYQFGISSQLTTANSTTAPSDISSWADAPMPTTSAKPYLWAKVQRKDGNGESVDSAYYIRLTGDPSLEYIIKSIDEIRIPSDETSISVPLSFTLWKRQRETETAQSAYFGYYWLDGNTYTQISRETTALTGKTLSTRSFTTAHDAFVIVAASSIMPSNAMPTTYYTKKEIRIHKDGDTGPAGENLVRIDLTNEADIISCLSDGKVRYNRQIQTTARIYDGAAVAPGGVTRVSSSLVIGGCTPQITSVTGGFTITWDFTTQHTITNTSLPIALQYKGNTYTAMFSLGVTNTTYILQLSPTPSSLSLARDDDGSFVHDTESVEMNVVRIEGDNVETLANVDDLKVYWGYDDAGSLSSSENLGDEVSFSTSVLSGHWNIVLELWRVSGSTKVALLDRETIPITKDGELGVSYYMTVDNESFALDSGERRSVNITANLWKRQDTESTYAAYMSYYKISVDGTVELGRADSNLRYQWSVQGMWLEATTAKVVFFATNSIPSTSALPTRYIAKKEVVIQRGGEKGDDAVSYSIEVTNSETRVDARGVVHAFAYWKVWRKAGNAAPSVVSAETGLHQFRLNNESGWHDADYNSANVMDTADYYDENPPSSVPTALELRHADSNGNTFVSLSVPFTYDGKMGRNFYYAGVYDPTATYTLTAFSAPFVVYRDSGATVCYVLTGDDGYTSRGETPGNTGPWEMMTTDFKYLITEAVFTEFAKLGASVFNGDYMFSQDGVMRGYGRVETPVNDGSQFQYIDPTDMDGENMDGNPIISNTWSGAYDKWGVTLGNCALTNGRYYSFEVDVEGLKDDKFTLIVKTTGNATRVSKEFTLDNNSDRIALCMNFKSDITSGNTAFEVRASNPSGRALFYYAVKECKFAPNLYIDLRTGKMVANNLTARGMLYASSVGYSHITGTANDETLRVGSESFVVLKASFQSNIEQARVILPAPSGCQGRVIEVIASGEGGTWYMTWDGANSGAAFGWPWGGTGHRVVDPFSASVTYVKLYSDGTIWRIMKIEQ